MERKKLKRRKKKMINQILIVAIGVTVADILGIIVGKVIDFLRKK